MKSLNVINNIKLAIKNNIKKFNIKKSNWNKNILVSFMKLGIIKYITYDIKKKNIKVYVNINENKIIFSKIKIISTSKKKMNINLNQLKKLNLKNNKLFLLSTSMGIINNFEAEKKKVGGIILLYFYN